MSQFSVSSELMARYVLNRQKDLEVLKKSLLEKDFSIIASKAHNLKGSAESFGFPELGVIGNELEAAALSQCEQDVQTNLTKIEDWVDKCLAK